MMIEEVLVEHGYDSVENATSQEQAIAMATARCPDLITVDDKLDSGSGVEAIREICRHQALSVVFITADRPCYVPLAKKFIKPFVIHCLTCWAHLQEGDISLITPHLKGINCRKGNNSIFYFYHFSIYLNYWNYSEQTTISGPGLRIKPQTAH